MEHRFAFTQHFDGAVYSCAVGASKPSREIFRAAIRAAEAPPARILFVDDVREYTVAARRLGMQSIQFRNRGQFERELRCRKLI
jgi:HAD superfamily hydrolase (TIGR01509 family)